MTTTHVKPARCPECRSTLSALAPAFADEQPQPGDVTICLYCAAMLMLDRLLQPQAMTPEQRAAVLADDPELADMVAMAQHAAIAEATKQ